MVREGCIKGKFTNDKKKRNREPRAIKLLEIIHIELTGPSKHLALEDLRLPNHPVFMIYVL